MYDIAQQNVKESVRRVTSGKLRQAGYNSSVTEKTSGHLALLRKRLAKHHTTKELVIEG
jgi:hypothetical protein